MGKKSKAFMLLVLSFILWKKKALVKAEMNEIVTIFNKLSPKQASLVSLLSSSTLVWFYSLFTKDVSIVDSFWSLGFLLSSIVYRIKAPKGIRVRPIPLSEINQNNQIENTTPHTKLLIWIKKTITSRSSRTMLFVTLWAFRLSIYLTWRNYNLPEGF